MKEGKGEIESGNDNMKKGGYLPVGRAAGGIVGGWVGGRHLSFLGLVVGMARIKGIERDILKSLKDKVVLCLDDESDLILPNPQTLGAC